MRAHVVILAATVSLVGCGPKKVLKRGEFEINLEKIGKAAAAEYRRTGSFPTGEADLAPAAPCCEGPGKRCAPSAADWQGPIWQALHFGPTEPFYFRYSYKSDGKTYEADAVGDLDCDGSTVTFMLHGSVDAAGKPTSMLMRPNNPD